jgi:hypothetical protein
LNLMRTYGFSQRDNVYKNGDYSRINWTNREELQEAISRGPVKIVVNASYQLMGAWMKNFGQTAWIGDEFSQNKNLDHCVSLCGYGTVEWLAQKLNQITSSPVGLSPEIKLKPAYAMFTWGSIGIITEKSLLAITGDYVPEGGNTKDKKPGEAWLRKPTVKEPVSLSPSALAAVPLPARFWPIPMLPHIGVYYVATNNHVHELAFLGGAWHHRDITADSRDTEDGEAKDASPGTVLTVTLDGNQNPRVYYQAPILPGNTRASHVHELAGSISDLIAGGISDWKHRNITPIPSGTSPYAVPGSALTATGRDGPRVYYVASNNHLYEQVLPDVHGKLSSNGLEITGDQHPVAPRGAVTTMEAGSVYYVAADNTVCNVSEEQGKWGTESISGVAAAGTGSALTVAFGSNDGPEGWRVYYLSENNHVHEILWTGNDFKDTDITAAAVGGKRAYLRSALSAVGIKGAPHVFYLALEDNNLLHVHDLCWGSNRWTDFDITAQSQATPARSSSHLTAIVIGGNEEPHVYYLAADNHVHEISWGGSGWNHRDVTAESQELGGDMVPIPAA